MILNAAGSGNNMACKPWNGREFEHILTRIIRPDFSIAVVINVQSKFWYFNEEIIEEVPSEKKE